MAGAFAMDYPLEPLDFGSAWAFYHHWASYALEVSGAWADEIAGYEGEAKFEKLGEHS